MFYDDNGISIDGKTSLSDSVDQVARFKSAGWNASRIDGHDQEAILNAVRAAQNSDRPTMIACKTTIGFGSPTKAGTNKAHGEALGAEEVAGARKNLNWPYEPFVVPEDILAAWRTIGARGAPKREAWKGRSKRSTPRRGPNSSGVCAAICRRTSTPSSTPTSESSPPTRRRSRPARRARRR